jgi:hypothetical protein
MKKLIRLIILLFAGAAILWTCTAKKNNAPTSAVNTGRGAKDTVLLEYRMHLRDTFDYHLDIDMATVDRIVWTINNDTVGSGQDIRYVSSSLSDTGNVYLYAFSSHRTGAIDTFLILLQVISQRPEISFWLTGHALTDTLSAAQTYGLNIHSLDSNGVLKRLLFDFNGDGRFEDSVFTGAQETTLVRRLFFSYAGRQRIMAGAMDNDNYLSRDTLFLNVKPFPESLRDSALIDTFIFFRDTLSYTWSGTADSIKWVFMPGETLATQAGFRYLSRGLSDTGQKVLYGQFFSHNVPALGRVVINVIAGYPVLTLSGPDTTYLDSIYHIKAAANDPHGKILAILWDRTGDDKYEDTTRFAPPGVSAVDSFRISFRLPTTGVYQIYARAMDNDSLLSPRQGFTVSPRIMRPDTVLYLPDSVPLQFKNIDPRKTAAHAFWTHVYPYEIILPDTARFCALNTQPGTHVILGQLQYTDGTFDSTRIIVDLRSGSPKIDSLRFSPNLGPDSLSSDSTTHFIPVTGDSAYSVTLFASDPSPNGYIAVFYRHTFPSSYDSTDVSGLRLPAIADTVSCSVPSACGDTVSILVKDREGAFSNPTTLIFRRK